MLVPAPAFKRPSWDLYFLRLAFATATRASCPRKQVGAIIIRDRDRRIISSGYNGAPRGLPSCDEVGCDVRVLPGGKPEGSCVRTIHAESNALDLAGPVSAESHTLFCTVIPCRDCALRIIQAGIRRVVFYEFYDSRGSHETLALFKTNVPPPNGSGAHLVQVTQYEAPLEVVRPAFADPDGSKIGEVNVGAIASFVAGEDPA